MSQKSSKAARSQARQISSTPATPEVQENAGNCSDISPSELTPRQVNALPLIAAAPSNAGGARLAGISEHTLYNWLEDEKFRAELIRIRQETAALARTEIQGAMFHAVSVMVDCTFSQNDAVRLRAASCLYNIGLKVGDFQQLKDDLQQLQSVLAEAQQ